MQDIPGISFSPNAVVVVFGAVIVAATAFLCWLAWRRSGCRRSTALLEFFRFFLVCLIVVTLAQPEWVEIQPPDQDPALVVLWDESRSMETRDVADTTALVGPPISRADALKPLLAEAAWAPAGEDLKVVFEPFSSLLDPPEEGTDINEGLLRVLEKHSNLRGVVVLSDGDWNVGRSPVEAASRFRMKQIPIFAVGAGSAVPLPDLELASMDAPAFGVVEKTLRIPFVIRNTMGQDREVRVVMFVNDEEQSAQVVRVPAMGRTQDNATWIPDETGDFTVSMRIESDARETILENNEIRAPISIRREQLKILVVESYPRWEYRYLRNALERDPGVEVSCLLFHPDLPDVGGGRRYIDRFPDRNELSGYDVIFLGDVGVGPEELTTEQLQDIRQLVSAQASGLVLIPGRTGRQQTLITGPLADLYPVIPDPENARGIGSEVSGHFALTQAGHRSLLMRLADTEEENGDIWRTLPGFHWYAGIERARPGAEVLAVHDRDSTDSGRVPLVVTKPYGTGKVLFMGTDSAWRWREGVEDKYHYRFWAQVARWMAYQRQMVQGESMRLFYSPDRPRVDDLVTLNANVLDRFGGPLTEGNVVLQVISPGGRMQTIHLQAGESDSWGLFSGSFIPNEPGDYRLVASCAETGESIEAELSVQGWNRERVGQLARLDVLEEMVRIAEGEMVPVSEVDRLLDQLAAMPEPEPVMHRIRIWAHPLWGGFLIFLLGMFWVGRKMAGVV
jgi:hypothetical protein